jgi:hypothetical protein
MKNKFSILFAGILLIAYLSPAHADSVVQLWTCQLNEGKTRTELTEISMAWMKAVRSMEGAEGFEGFLEFPIAADDASVFTFVLVAGSASSWGAYQDAYEGSVAEEVDEDWGKVADCSKSSLWSSVKLQ